MRAANETSGQVRYAMTRNPWKQKAPGIAPGGLLVLLGGAEAQASAPSSVRLRVWLGSTWTPGPMVVETTVFLM
jgi:hypothetical protein